jgi:hypothetical protein
MKKAIEWAMVLFIAGVLSVAIAGFIDPDDMSASDIRLLIPDNDIVSVTIHPSECLCSTCEDIFNAERELDIVEGAQE